MTGHAPDDSLWDDGFVAGVPVLYKPVRRRELLAAIEAALKTDDRLARQSADEGKEPTA